MTHLVAYLLFALPIWFAAPDVAVLPPEGLTTNAEVVGRILLGNALPIIENRDSSDCFSTHLIRRAQDSPVSSSWPKSAAQLISDVVRSGVAQSRRVLPRSRDLDQASGAKLARNVGF